MPIRQKQRPVRFTARGLVDAFDATDKFPGACLSLSNLVFDQSNPEIMVSRPGVSTLVSFGNALNYLNLPGAVGDYASTPNAAANRITGDLEIISYLAATDWQAAFPAIASKWLSAGNQLAYKFLIDKNTGFLTLTFSTDGVAQSSHLSTAAPVVSNGAGLWVRTTLQVNNGAAGNVTTFYTSTNPSTTAPTSVIWTQLGAAVVGVGAINIFASTADLEVGAINNGTQTNFSGKIFSVYVYAGIGGTLKASMVANDTTNGSVAWNSALTGEAWTANGAAFVVGGTFNTPGIISVHATVGNITYGMIGSARNAGKDEPFAYNHSTSAFLAVAGVTGANCPVTQAGSGPWTPPTMASVGVNIIVTHPGFPGAATKFGWFDITVPTAPVWTAGDTATNALPSIPVAVANFNNRAYFACANTLNYTDVLTLTITSATQALTLGDVSAITALCGLPIQTTSGGVVAALIAWKAFQVWQVTGDPATPGGSNLAHNFLSLTVGTRSPRSIAQAPLGVYFADISGPFIITQFGILQALTFSGQQTEPDVHAPWENAQEPSRIAAGYSGTIYRACMKTLILGAVATNDYWFDEHKHRWNGPHTFTYDCVSQLGNFFVLASNDHPAQLIKSEMESSGSGAFTDLGASITITEQSSTFPKTGDMEMKQVVESTMELASAGGPASYSITAQDDLGNSINNCNVAIVPAGALWGAAVWGGFAWASAVNRPTTYTVPWTAPLVFKKMSLYITATASSSLALGTFMARYQDAGYTNLR